MVMRRESSGEIPTPPVQIHKSNSCPPDFVSRPVMVKGHLSPPTSSTGKRRAAGPSSGNGIGLPMGDGSASRRAVPGRPRRRLAGATSNGAPEKTKRKRKKRSFPFQNRLFSLPSWVKNPMDGFSAYASLMVAVLLWYTLGVVSITTSNLLMMAPSEERNYVGGVPPLYLTLQQLMIGTSMLRGLLHIRFLGSTGVQPWPNPSAIKAANNRRFSILLFNNSNLEDNKRKKWISDMISSNLVMAGIFFALGFLATNAGFLSSSAAFVETIKAAEPITSAVVAVIWGIETLSGQEVMSLGSIVTGVLISTLAHTHANSTSVDESVKSTLAQTLLSCGIVVASNLCFSFRGLYQKLFRASPEGTSQVVDDLNLQFRMQQLGVGLLALPVLVFNVPGIIASIWELSSEVGLIKSGVLVRYVALALANGIAFTSYNLASTYILSRISVVHHAALNCIRRIFAIIVTSIFFRITITTMGVLGFFISFGGFMAFTHFKVQKQRQPKPLSSLLPVSASMNAE